MKFIIVLSFLLIYSTSIIAQNNSLHQKSTTDSLEIPTMIKVYIAGPYSKGDVAVNVRNAFEVANKLADLGFAPFIPHYTHFWHMMFPRPYEFWLKLDKQFLPCCDALLRLPGESHGSDTEVDFARSLDIPVFFDIESLVNYFKKLEKKK